MGECLISKWKEIFHFQQVWKGLESSWKSFQEAFRGEGWVCKHVAQGGPRSKDTAISNTWKKKKILYYVLEFQGMWTRGDKFSVSR